MNTGVLDMLADGPQSQLAAAGDCIHFELSRVLHELRYDHGILLRDVARALEELDQLDLSGGHPHRRAAEDVGGAHENGITYATGKRLGGFVTHQLLPLRLFDPESIEQPGEFVPVF